MFPQAALRDGAVFIIEDGKAKKIPVTLGMPAGEGQIEITGGLIGGEDLIVHPPEALQEGARVTAATPG